MATFHQQSANHALVGRGTLSGQRGPRSKRFSLALDGANVRRIVCSISPILLALAALGADETTFHPDIPRVWDDRAVETMEVPWRSATVRHAT
jgi:hypothetical protein